MLDVERVVEKPHDNSKWCEKREIEQGQNDPSEDVADELADALPRFPNRFQYIHDVVS